MDLESQITSLKADRGSINSAMMHMNRDPINWLPGKPTHILESHRGGITCVSFHPTFTSIASGSDDCTIKIWDWELGEPEKTLKGLTRPVNGLDFGGQKDQILLASCSNDLLIKIWDPSKNYANVRTLSGHDHSVSCVRFLRSDDNTLVSASRDASIRI